MARDEYERREFKVIGTRPQRPDGIDKVTGRALYGADMQAPGMLVGKVLRSPHAHARIRSIDTSAAAALPGVKAVVTGADFGDIRKGETRNVAENAMARDKALYDGHAVAAVAAVSEAIAKQALRLIEVDYEVLPHVTEIGAAMKPEAPVVHAGFVEENVPDGFSENVNAMHEFGHGDLEAGFQKADKIIAAVLEAAAEMRGEA